MADSRDYLMNVDAVGSDFRLYPIPNCGKGQPMQTKKLGNGGPPNGNPARPARGRGGGAPTPRVGEAPVLLLGAAAAAPPHPPLNFLEGDQRPTRPPQRPR